MSVDFPTGPARALPPPEEDLGPVAEPTVFDELSAVLERRRAAAAPTLSYALTQIPELTVTYRLPIHRAELQKTEKAGGDEADALLLARCCVGLALNGRPMVEADGEPCTWASRKVRERFGGERAVETLTNAYAAGDPARFPAEGEIGEHVKALVRAAGFGDATLGEPLPPEGPDPTRGR